MKKILVTGGGGFIGQYVCDQLSRNAYEPVILDHYNRGGYKYAVILADIRDESAIVEAFAHVDGFIHLAAVLGTQETINNPMPAVKTNTIGGVNILQAAAQYETPGVYIGVGNHWMNNPYSITKSVIERFIAMYNKERGTRINIVRAMNAYGPGQRPAPPFGSSKVRKITPSFVCRALTNMPIEIYGDGEQISDMVYVSDVAKCLVRSLDKAIDGEVFNESVEIGPEENMTVNQVAELVIDLSQSTSKIVHLPMRPGEIPGAKVTASTETLKLVNMNNLTPIDEGMKKTIDYYREILK